MSNPSEIALESDSLKETEIKTSFVISEIETSLNSGLENKADLEQALKSGSLEGTGNRLSMVPFHSDMPLHNPVDDSGYYIGCIPKNKKNRYICLGIFAAILCIIALFLGLFFPRMPNFKVESIAPQTNSDSGFSLELDRNNPDGLRFSMKLNMKLNVINSNFYHLKVEKIYLNAYVRANISEINNAVPSPGQAIFQKQFPDKKRVDVTTSNYQRLIGTAEYGTLYMPRDEQISFFMQLQVDYKPNEELGIINDPTFNELIQTCVFADQAAKDGRMTTIYYEAMNDIAAVRWIGYNPVIQGQIRIRCPVQGN